MAAITRPKGYGLMSQVFPNLNKTLSPVTLKLVPAIKPPLKPDTDTQVDDFHNYIGNRGILKTDSLLGYYYISYPDYCKTTDSPYSQHTFQHLVATVNCNDILEWNGVYEYPFAIQVQEGLKSPRLGGTEGKDFNYIDDLMSDNKCIPISTDLYDTILEYLGELSPYEDSNHYMYQLNMSYIKQNIEELYIGSDYSDRVLECVLSNEFSDYLRDIWGGNEVDGPFWYEPTDSVGYPAVTARDEEILEQILGPPVNQASSLEEFHTALSGDDDIPWDYGAEIAKLEASIEPAPSLATGNGGGSYTLPSDEYDYHCWLQNHTSSGPRPTVFKKRMMIGGYEYTKMLRNKLQSSIDSVKTVLSREEMNAFSTTFKRCPLLHEMMFDFDTLTELEDFGYNLTYPVVLDALCFLSDLDPAGWYSNESPALYMADPRPPTVDQLLTQYYATCAERRAKQGILQPRIISNKVYAKAMNIRMHNTSIQSEYLSSLTRAMVPDDRQVTSNHRLKKPGKNIYRINDVTIFERILFEYDNTIEITGDCIGYSHEHEKPFNVYPMKGAPLYSALRKGEQGLVKKVPKIERIPKWQVPEEEKVGVISGKIADTTLKRLKARQLLAAKQEQWADATLLAQQVRSVAGHDKKRAKRRSVEEDTQVMMMYPERAEELKDMGIEPVATTSREAANEIKSINKVLSESLHSKLTSIPRKVVAKVKDKIESLDREDKIIGAIMDDLIKRENMQDMITDANSKSMEDIMNDSTIVFAPSREHSGLLLPKEVLMADDQVKIVRTAKGEFRIATG